MLSFFPLEVLDEIWDLIESVSEGFLTYFWPIYIVLAVLGAIGLIIICLSRSCLMRNYKLSRVL